MKTNFGKLFSDEELNQIRSQFYYVDRDFNGEERIFFDNAGGSLRLKQAEDTFHRIDSLPDCAGHSNKTARYLAEIEAKGREDTRIIFNAQHGAIATGYTASELIMYAAQVIAEHAVGSNYVTTALEHPSAYDAIRINAQKHHCEFRAADANKKTGAVDADAVLSLVDKNTAILSVMSASNISGHVMDIETIAKKAREINPDIFIISDAVQHAPHGALDPENIGVDVMNFAPYKFYGIRGFALMYLSDRVASFGHFQVMGNPADDWEVGSSCTANLAAMTEIVDYVCHLGSAIESNSEDRRKLFELGMERISAHERALLEIMLEGTPDTAGLRHIDGITVKMDDEDLNQRDFIIGIEFDALPCEKAVEELEKRNIVTFERAASSYYSKRMVEQFDSEGVVRISPLHVNTVDEVIYFLHAAQEVAKLKK